MDEIKYRVNDDGEPTNSAGQPIYGQILSFDVTNILIVVVRYFGGTKLGIGGLMNAYKIVAQYGLENADIIKKTININFRLQFEYAHLNKVMRIVKEQHLEILEQNMNLNCKIIIAVRRKKENEVENLLNELHYLKFEKLMPNSQ